MELGPAAERVIGYGSRQTQHRTQGNNHTRPHKTTMTAWTSSPEYMRTQPEEIAAKPKDKNNEKANLATLPNNRWQRSCLSATTNGGDGQDHRERLIQTIST